MDVSQPEQASQNQTAVEIRRPPLIPGEKNNNNGVTHRAGTIEVGSGYKSPSPSIPSVSRRGPFPNITRTVSSPSPLVPKIGHPVERKRPSTPPSLRFPSLDITRTGSTPSSLVPKRAHSVERKCPSTPPSPRSPSMSQTFDSSTSMQLSSMRSRSCRFPDGLWPSTMRSLSVSFQSDTISVPVSKKEKPVTRVLSDHTVKPSLNVAHKKPEKPTTRKPTPERKKSPYKGKSLFDQSENSKPADSLHARLVDQHRWPSRAGGKVSSNVLNGSVELTDSNTRVSATIQGKGLSPSRVPISDVTSRRLQIFASDAAIQLTPNDIGRVELEACSANDNLLRLSGLNRSSSSVSDRMRSQALPNHGSRSSSPSKRSVFSPSLCRGVSSSKTRPSTPPSGRSSPSQIRPSTPPCRGISPSKTSPSTPPIRVSPSRIRPSTTPPSRGVSPSRISQMITSSQSICSISVLSFIADVRKGKKVAGQIEDVHHLRLLYNRLLQWRYVNARADTAQDIQRVTAEKIVYNVWRTTLALWDLVINQRINLQQLKLGLKLNAVLNKQMTYLDGWALHERDHACSLSEAIEDLEACTLRLPVNGGARADIQTVKLAMCSAAVVMQSMGSSLCSFLSRVEGMNSLVSGLADVVALERTMIGECEALLATTAAMQMEEYSIRSHLIQFDLLNN